MNRFAAGSVAALLTITHGRPAVVEDPKQCTRSSATVTDWYKQSVDASNSKIGDVRRVLLSADG